MRLGVPVWPRNLPTSPCNNNCRRLNASRRAPIWTDTPSTSCIERANARVPPNVVSLWKFLRDSIHPATTHLPPSYRSFQSGANRSSQPSTVHESPSQISKAPAGHSTTLFLRLSASSVSRRIPRAKPSQPSLTITVHTWHRTVFGNPANQHRPTTSLFLRSTSNRSAQQVAKPPQARRSETRD